MSCTTYVHTTTVSSSSAEDDVHARISIDNARHLSHTEGKRSIFKGFLHHTPPKIAQIAAILEGTAVGACACLLCEVFGRQIRHYLREFGDGLFLRHRNLLTSTTGYWVARTGMLAQKV